MGEQIWISDLKVVICTDFLCRYTLSSANLIPHI